MRSPAAFSKRKVVNRKPALARPALIPYSVPRDKMRILIAYDGSAGAEAAVNDLVRAGLPVRAEAMVLTIADVWLPPELQSEETGSLEAGRYAAAYENAAEVLRNARQTAVHGARLVHGFFPDWSVGNAARAESPAWGIIAEARRWPASLIVIGSHGRNPLERFFLGSVSAKVAAEAGCSVRIMRPHARQAEHTRLIIAIDGSEDSRRAVNEVLGRRWSSGTEIDLVTILDPKLRSVKLRSSAGNAGEAASDAWVEPLHHELTELFSAKELVVRSRILDGDPKSTLLNHAGKSNASCIFLGARGLDHGNRLYLGTFASAIATRAPCSVEIVRPPFREGPAL